MKRKIGLAVVSLLAIAVIGPGVFWRGGGAVVISASARRDEGALRPGSLSPYEIAWVVNEAADLWDTERRTAEVDLAGTWRALGVEPAGFETCGGDCEAETSRHDLDKEEGKEVVLKLTKGFDLCRYLIFSRNAGDGKSAAATWKLLGFVDHDFNRYEMSSHRVIPLRDRNWLVVRGQGGSGSGFSLYGETWYEVGGGGVRPVLSYFSDGHCSSAPGGLSRSYDSEISNPRSSPDGPDAVTIRYSVSYYAWHASGKDEGLLLNSHRVRYVWDEGRRGFVFEEKTSDITPDEIAAVAGAEDPEPSVWVGEVFLKYNLKALLEIARGEEGERRDWLRRFLEECPETKESKALSKALREKTKGPARRSPGAETRGR